METVVVATTFRILENLEIWHFGNFQVKKKKKIEIVKAFIYIPRCTLW